MEKVLYGLNGKYLKGMEQMSSRKFEPLQLNWERYEEVQKYINNNLTSTQKQRLDNIFKLIHGFESSLSLEILASIHYLLHQDSSLNQSQLLEKIKAWNKRKEELITEEYVDIALTHLKDYGNTLEMV